MNDSENERRARNIRMIILDVDGTMTDGAINIGDRGELFKTFYCKDGMGIALWHHVGFKTAIITGRKSEIVKNRAEELRIESVTQGVVDKRKAYADLKEKYNISDKDIAYIGDDLNDLPVLKKAGLAIAVGDATDEVKSRVHMVTEKRGGHGAIREAIEFILKAQGRWDALMDELF